MGLGSKTVKVLVAVIAIFIGIIKYAPHIVFAIPGGFILHAISGGAMPPYFDPDPYTGSTDWLKPNDVIVAAAAKSGTTWMLFCSHQIRVKGDDETYPYVDVSLSTPWPEWNQKPGDTWDQRRVLMNTTVLPDGKSLKDYWDNPAFDFRIFKSHYTPEIFGDLIGGDSKVKFLAMARNGLDQVASAVPFFDKHTDSFRKMWGGFPPKDGGATSEKAQEIASVRLKQMMPGGMFEAWYFKYVNNWWKAKDEDNVLLLHYSDAKKDLGGTVSKMAEFYGVDLSEKEHENVVHKCSFDYMKKRTDMFGYTIPLNSDIEGRIMEDGAMTRKGGIGDGGTLFSEQEKAAWAKAEEEQYGDDPKKLNWARNGGL